MVIRLILLFLFMALPCLARPTSHTLLYTGLDPQSVTQQLAFYELYPETQEGQAALQRAWTLLSGQGVVSASLDLGRLQSLVELFAKQRVEPSLLPSPHEVEAIDAMGRSRLCHHGLAGHSVWTEAEVVALPDSQVDLARGLFLSLGLDPEAIRAYEAVIDLMALQVLARLSIDSPPDQKIRAINHLLFEERGIRFPPHALVAKGIDHYTFLPSVLDSQRGVCLGVSSLYLSIAQRLALPLEPITPPGHIFVRYREGDRVINIETTMRGVNIPSSEYLGVQTRSLEQRTIKEVIGLTFMNDAASYWTQGEYGQAIAQYERARLYLPDDPLLKEFLAYTLLIAGREEEGMELLTQVCGHIPDYAISPSTMVEDLLAGRIDARGIDKIFDNVDERRESILDKQQEMAQLVDWWPEFRAGWFHLATTYLQLGHSSGALEALERAHALDPNDETVEYYLAVLSMERYNYPKAWSHLRRAESLVAARGHSPKALRELRRELRRHAPDPFSHLIQ